MRNLTRDADRESTRDRTVAVVREIVGSEGRRRSRGRTRSFGVGIAAGAAALIACAALWPVPASRTGTPPVARKPAVAVARRESPPIAASPVERHAPALSPTARGAAASPKPEPTRPVVKALYAAASRAKPAARLAREPRRTEAPPQARLAKLLPNSRSPEAANRYIAEPLTGEALRLALIEDSKRTRRLNEAELDKLNER